MIVTIKVNDDSFMGSYYYDLSISKGLININGKPSSTTVYEKNNKRWLISGKTKQKILDLINKKLPNSFSKKELIKKFKNYKIPKSKY